ncbi:MAG: hypothetical protein GX915_00935 [Clostridiales bacterium]|nr:hypothetical protein [Clostridiales bacterium]
MMKGKVIQMDKYRKLIIGCDLCEDFTQVSCYSYKQHEPIIISDKKDDNGLIPTVLCVKHDTKQWLFGEEALSCSSENEGILIDNILSKIKSGEETIIYDQKFLGINLLEKFLRKSLMLVKNYFPTEPITKIVVTISNSDPHLVNAIYETLYLLGIEKDRAVIISHPGVYMYYALSQERALWINDVGLFDFNDTGLNYYQIHTNRSTRPIVAGLLKKDLTDVLTSDMLEDKGIDLGYVFRNAADRILYKQIISTLYFTGKGFKGNWAEDAIKSLCQGRRAFIGQNLYTKGACYAAKEFSGDRELSDYILLNEEMITSSIWIRVYKDGKVKEVSISEAAVEWYLVDQNIEVILDEVAEINLILKNIMTKEVVREKLVLNQLPERPKRITRLDIHISCLSSSQLKVDITDLGFGELYPASGQVWEFVIEI